MDSDLKIGTLNVNHPFYSVARGQKEGINAVGEAFKSLFGTMFKNGVPWAEQSPVLDALLKTKLWQRCHNWTEGRPASIAEEVNRMGVQVLCLQEVSDRYASHPEDAPSQEECREAASRTLVDLKDELNAAVGEDVWEALPFVAYANSKDLEYDGATECGDAILVDTRYIDLTEQHGVYDCDLSSDDKQLVRRHPWTDLVHKSSGKLIRVSSAHISGYPRFTEKLRANEERWNAALAMAEKGNQELRGLLEELSAAPGEPAVTILGMDLNENMKKHELPEGLERRAPSADGKLKGMSILRQFGFFTNWSGLKSKDLPSTEHGKTRCIDAIAFNPSDKVSCHRPDMDQDVVLSNHKLTVLEFRF